MRLSRVSRTARSSSIRKSAYRLLLLLALLALVGGQYAAQSGAPTGSEEPSQSGSQEETLPEFEPTETVSADDAVPFPVDI